jgi:hypothetical protein
MSIAPSLTVLNRINSGQNYQGTDITLTSIKSLNENSSWEGPSEGTILTSNGNTAKFISEQNGIVLPPQTVGIQIQFEYNFTQKEKNYTQNGEIYLLVPPEGEHTLFGKTLPSTNKPKSPIPIPNFNYSIVNPGMNAFEVIVTL